MMLIITLIKGDKINNWTNAQLKEMDTNVAKETQTTNKFCWTNFKWHFRDTLNFKTKNQDTLSQIQILQMTKDNEVEIYNALFNQLLKDTGFNWNEQRTKLYKQGLPCGI
jgi:hypothetical protein